MGRHSPTTTKIPTLRSRWAMCWEWMYAIADAIYRRVFGMDWLWSSANNNFVTTRKRRK